MLASTQVPATCRSAATFPSSVRPTECGAHAHSLLEELPQGPCAAAHPRHGPAHDRAALAACATPNRQGEQKGRAAGAPETMGPRMIALPWPAKPKETSLTPSYSVGSSARVTGSMRSTRTAGLTIVGRLGP